MTELLSALQMRAIEEAAIDSGAVTGLDLMERAGRGVVEAVFEEWPDLAAASHRAVVLCGPGNNGGDGFVVARLLSERDWQVEVFFYGDPENLPPDARANWLRLPASIAVHRLALPRPAAAEADVFEEAASHVPHLRRHPGDAAPPPFLLVDALFGIGLSRPLQGLDQIVWHWDYLTNFPDLNDARVVAIDVPSGLDADTGQVVAGPGMSGTGILPAQLTVTFHRLKQGHAAGRGPALCGKVVVKDIGL